MIILDSAIICVYELAVPCGGAPNGLGLGGGGPFPFVLVKGGGLVGSRGLDLSMLEENDDFSSALRLKLAVRSESSLVVEVASDVEFKLSVATVRLRGFLMTSEAF